MHKRLQAFTDICEYNRCVSALFLCYKRLLAFIHLLHAFTDRLDDIGIPSEARKPSEEGVAGFSRCENQGVP